MTWHIATSNKPEVLWQFISTGRSTLAKIESVEFIESSDQTANIRYQTVLINLPKWDEYWKQDACNFVPDNLQHFPQHCCKTEVAYQAELAMHRQKIERWEKEIPQTGRVPAVCFENTLVEGRLKIKQGRHRIAYLRQIGFSVFAAAIPINLLSLFKENHLITEM
ncbi:hypothetical protein [Thiomicrorhabdus indica]|uniref:hypothetical protein n=1 Tax=Thiomicrorhabdus indica TaxID=2267253 RepID=UPI002AA7E283|nr:hypothetical protein [Thiomicrorhabdus indica]